MRDFDGWELRCGKIEVVVEEGRQMPSYKRVSVDLDSCTRYCIEVG
jgi:hypothetical protein